jgi:hypothetical protein
MGQEYLVLYKSGTSKKFFFPERSLVRIVTTNSDTPYYASLDKIGKSYFLSGADTIFFKDISIIYLPEPIRASRAVQLIGKSLNIAGYGIVMVDLINQAIIDEPWKANTTLWTVGLSAGTAGILSTVIKRKKRKVKGMWKLQKRTAAL